MSNAADKIANLRMAEMGVGWEQKQQPDVGEAQPIVSALTKKDQLTEELIGSTADELRDAFEQAAIGRGFKLRNTFSSDDLRQMVVWLMRMHFVKGGE